MIGAILLVAAGVVAVVGPPDVAGWPKAEAVAVLLYAAGLAWLTAWAAERARPGWREAIGAVAMWSVFVASLTMLYTRRDDATATIRAMAEDLGIGEPATVVTGSGEVAVTRRADGTFRLPATVNGRPVSFMFDTGASAAVLTHETAQALGYKTSGLSFRVPVATANGRTLAAPITMSSVSIGPIRLSNVRALVTGPGLLSENLLGQTMLDRFDSYEVRGNRLVLRAGKG